jgi:choline dehydrogenase-like flavoprotein
VVGETGESFDVRGLYVADGSAFPAPSGVNPMITIMAIADQVARGIAAAT